MIRMQGETDLFEVVQALEPVSRFPRLLDGGQQQAQQDSEEGDNTSSSMSVKALLANSRRRIGGSPSPRQRVRDRSTAPSRKGGMGTTRAHPGRGTVRSTWSSMINLGQAIISVRGTVGNRNPLRRPTSVVCFRARRYTRGRFAGAHATPRGGWSVLP